MMTSWEHSLNRSPPPYALFFFPTRDPAHRRAALQKGRDAALARSDAGVRGLGKADGSAAAAGALRPR